MKLLHVVGARPNFPKIAPLMAALRRRPEQLTQLLVHTGQHYDERMSAVFFRDLALPQPDVDLGVGSGSHAEQTARVMLAFEAVVLREAPDWVIVVGDVNSTLACALVCAKLGVKLAHVEAGLRSFDRAMPEEINRVVTDQLADLLLTPSPDADSNLLREGIAADRIHCVGNIMLDSVLAALPAAADRPIMAQLHVEPHRYGLVTLHRPANVDNPAALTGIWQALTTVARELPLVFPLHPRTRDKLNTFGLTVPAGAALHLVEPQSYLDFLRLTHGARLVLTDSGGLQEETTFLGVPCLTLRPNTERPITVSAGTNRVVGTDPTAVVDAARDVLAAPMPHRPHIAGWDGRAAERIAALFGAMAASS